MHQNPRFLILLLSLLFLPIIFFDAKAEKVLLGGWTPIENITDPHVTEIAEFAVTEYNKQSKTTLKLLKVVKGETQVVAGLNYKLLLNATDGAATNLYQAVVWEKAWEHYMNLTSFLRLIGE
ncbi:hypothetical protein CRYUN_Cryun34aG0004100 [Craigia yunnanensis]